jgi:hypothetical protein
VQACCILCCATVPPFMASLVRKNKSSRLYCYLLESARVEGKPCIVHHACLGTAEKLAQLHRGRHRTCTILCHPAAVRIESFLVRRRATTQPLASAGLPSERRTLLEGTEQTSGALVQDH